MRVTLKTGLMMPAALTVALLTSGCGTTTAHSETERTICRELRRDLPTSSTRDTDQSKAENADFRDVFKAVCG